MYGSPIQPLNKEMQLLVRSNSRKLLDDSPDGSPKPTLVSLTHVKISGIYGSEKAYHMVKYTNFLTCDDSQLFYHIVMGIHSLVYSTFHIFGSWHCMEIWNRFQMVYLYDKSFFISAAPENRKHCTGYGFSQGAQGLYI
jgi:hypothetical protein